ncbi:MAG: hypothetical protein Ct9H300mP25_10430 [Acidobacteriota bacterium]|nr:MAG: hypothetical protein Ct9H300mP25_10430 [Acidobacteriota bacterium]
MPQPLTFKSLTARPVLLKLKRPVIARIATITEWPLIFKRPSDKRGDSRAELPRTLYPEDDEVSRPDVA